MCGLLPMLAAGKPSAGALGAAALGGVGGLALRQAMKKKKPATNAQTFYGNTTGA